MLRFPWRGLLRGVAPLVLSLLIGAVASAGEVSLILDRAAKVNAAGKVLGIHGPGKVRIRGLPAGRHKVYLKDPDTGALALVFVEFPRQEGAVLPVDFDKQAVGGRTVASTSSRRAAAPRSSSRQVEEGRSWLETKEKIQELLDLHELSLETLDAFRDDIDELRDRLATRGSEASGGDLAAALFEGEIEAEEAEEDEEEGPDPAKVYLYLDGEYSGNDTPGDKGSFDLHHTYLGVQGDVVPRWSGRVEFEFEHGYKSTKGGAQGKLEVDRAYLTRQFSKGSVTLGKIFTPFGFWSPMHQALYLPTVQNPLQYKRIFGNKVTGVTLRASPRPDHRFVLGLYNGDGAKPAETDDNDNKAILIGYEKQNFFLGRLGLFYLGQRDGTQGDREEKKYAVSLEQSWRRFSLQSEYAVERAKVVGGIGDNDSWYADFRYNWTDKFSTAFRFDDITHQTGGAGKGSSQTRRLVNADYVVGPLLRFKADVYHDTFGKAGVASVDGFDLAIVAGVGL